MSKNIPSLLEEANELLQVIPIDFPKYTLELPLNAYLDCALHDPDATPDMIASLCEDAVQYGYATVFINPFFVPQAKLLLENSGVHVGTVVGFPLGAFPEQIKGKEAHEYLKAGADEIDMVMAVGMLKAGEYQLVFDEIKKVAEVVHNKEKIMKVILETALLTSKEIIISCLLCKAASADFVKTSTGFSKGGATVEDVQLMRWIVGPASTMGVKAAGGIRSYKDAIKMIEAGANRLGTRLADKILDEYAAGLGD